MTSMILPPPLDNVKETFRDKITSDIVRFERAFGNFTRSDEHWTRVSDNEEEFVGYSPDPTDINQVRSEFLAAEPTLRDDEIEVVSQRLSLVFDSEAPTRSASTPSSVVTQKFMSPAAFDSLVDAATTSPFLGDTKPTLPVPYSSF